MGGEVRNVNGNVVDGNYNHRPLIIVACVLAVFGLIMFACHRYYSFAHAIDDTLWGEFGDFIGGVVGTIIAYISIRLLIDTLKAQNNANSISRDASKESLYVYRLQQFNDNYQMLIKLFRETAGLFVNSNGTEKGLPYLKKKVSELCLNFDSKEKPYDEKVSRAITSFMDFYADNRDVASVYFRVLYRLLELLYDTKLYQRDKLKYAKILRCQISEAELFFIRYNAMTQNGANMKKFLNQYNILKHLPETSLMEFSFWPANKIKSIVEQNLMITYIIALRKSIIYQLTNDDSAELKQIGGRYDVSGRISDDYKQYTFMIARGIKSSEELLSKTLDNFTKYEIRDFFHDFLTELFKYYRFEEYLSRDHISIVNETPDEVDGKESILIKVNSQQPIVLYEDKDDNIVVEDTDEI